MTIQFFRHDPGALSEPVEPLGPALQLRWWRPQIDGYPPAGSRRLSNQFWWALEKLGGFARSGFAEIRIEQDKRVVHRLIVTPAWYRFPFMAAKDLQIGQIWTSPRARRKQLARAAIAEAHRRLADEQIRFWYVTDACNIPSQALARSCGYRLVGRGRRTSRFGISLLGQYVIDEFV